MAERSKGNRRPRYSRYLLSGVLRCGHCGGTLAGKGNSNGEGPRYYSCVTGQTRPGACCRYQIPQEPIEDYVIGVLERQLLSDQAVKKIIRAIHQQAKSKSEFKGQTKALKSQIEALDRKIAKGTENLLLANPEHFGDLSVMLGEWKTERARLQGDIERAAANRTAEPQRPLPSVQSPSWTACGST